jgi:hypothetical protein
MSIANVSGHLCVISYSSEIVINCLQIGVSNNLPLNVVQMCLSNIVKIQSWRFLKLLHSDIQSYGYQTGHEQHAGEQRLRSIPAIQPKMSFIYWR